MKLTIVIVNYNVRYFLEQCLLSVQKAIQGIDTEVYVVDNNSVDGSGSMVRERFPWVKFIENKVNTGFSKANNQAMRLAQGEYILLLNPDTIVEEDTFSKVIAYMDAHPKVGGLGVKMVDGKGNFLPESKRGLPTPATAFYKIFGLSKLFSKSPVFNRYHLGNLSKDETHEVEILSGAFMWMRKSALDQVGLLDETFFMYGEDIDLSWRIIQGGWKNVYFADTRIVHYKGESTKKGSLNYVFVFYQAMDIFAKKHFTQKNARLYSTVIQLAIWMRAAAAMLHRIVRGAVMPTLDVGLTLLCWYVVKDAYSAWKGIQYTDTLVFTAFGACALLWLMSVWLACGYDRPYRPSRVLRPILIGSGIVLMVYSLLPETMRFSRALILAGSALAMILFFINHSVMWWLTSEKKRRKRVAIAGKQEEVNRVMGLMKTLHPDADVIGVISPPSSPDTDALGTSNQLGDIARVHQVDEVIFCAADLSSQEIISAMASVNSDALEFRIVPPEAMYIIGSGNIQAPSDVGMVDVNSISLLKNRRWKRTFDVLSACLLLPFVPLFMWFTRSPWRLITNVLAVLFGKATWVGYASDGSGLPTIRKAIIHPQRAGELAHRHDVLYAKDYHVVKDISLWISHIKSWSDRARS